MDIKNKFFCFSGIIKSRLFNLRIPLAVRWQVTNRCTLQCRYCNLWQEPCRELSLERICRGLKELSGLGTKRISFSGGEPLLREDLGEMMRCAKRNGIYPEINTNGTLVAQKIDQLKDVDFVKISLDGPEEIHDILRGKGSFRKVMQAAEACVAAKIKFGFATTLTKYNVSVLRDILGIAHKFQTIVAFQPIKKLYRGIEKVEEFLPLADQSRQAVEFLIAEKKRGNKNIRNSLRGLCHILDWPRYQRLKCFAGRIFCIVDTNGDLSPCDRIRYKEELPNIEDRPIAEALNEVPPVCCDGCGFCGSLELNYLMAFKFGVISSMRKILS